MIVKDYKFVEKNQSFEVEFDCGTKVLVSYDIFEKYKISVDSEISDSEFEIIKFYSDIEFAKKIAVNFLKRRLKTQKEIEYKLKENGFDFRVIEETVDFLKDFEYIDDREYARLFIEEKINLNGYGLNRIKNLLYQKGVKEIDYIDFLEEVDGDIEFNNALELATKKLNSIYEDDEFKIKRKIFSYLSYRGFDYDVINRVLREII